MADEPKKDQPEEIESILSDLDAILTDMGGDVQAAAKPAEPPKPPPPPPPPAPAPQPVEMPKPVEAPKPIAPLDAPKAPVVPIESPKANQVELAPREGIIRPPEKKPEPPKPAPKLPDQKPIELSAVPSISMPADAPKAPEVVVVPPKTPEVVIDSLKVNQEPAKPAAPPPPLAAPPSPAAPPAPAAGAELPADAPKEQIRRVAYIHTSSCAAVKTAFAAFLSQAARTISKKPLFLREVLSHEVSSSSDTNAVLQKALQAKAVAILALVEDWPPAKVDELSDACSRANLQFRAVAPGDAQKKSTAVDIIVDMMLLPGEG